jgi:hypothetical protein
MFKDARATDRERTAASFDRAMGHYARGAESWFDGRVGSIDARLAVCERLRHAARATVARMDITHSGHYLGALEALESDHRALTALREDMLFGGQDRAPTRYAFDEPDDISSGPTPPSGPTESVTPSKTEWNEQNRPHEGALHGIDRRWVTLEAARFVTDNTDALASPHELATRAQHHAQVKTSTFTRERSAAISEAFVASVTELGVVQRPRRQRTAAAPIPVDFDASAMFVC